MRDEEESWLGYGSSYSREGIVVVVVEEQEEQEGQDFPVREQLR